MNYKDKTPIRFDVFLNNDYDEENPCTVYFIDNIFHAVYNNTGAVRYFKMTHSLEEIEPCKAGILDYSGIKADDTLTVSDVFMQGAFIKEVYPTKEMRVYFVDSSLDDYDDLPTFSNDCNDETFMDFAEREGNVYSLDGFTSVFNRDGFDNLEDHFIRFIETLTFT
jgi:hypothetical protein